MSNLDDFNRLIGIVFAQLYDSFPIPIDVHGLHRVLEAQIGTSHPQLSMEDRAAMREHAERLWRGEETLEDVAARERSEALFDIFEHAMNWLTQEGFIRVRGSEAGTEYFGVVLTHKGLQTLALTPDSLNPSLGDAMLEAARKGSIDGLGGLAKKAISEWGPHALLLAAQLFRNG